VVVLAIATLSALFFGLVPLLLPTQFGQVFGCIISIFRGSLLRRQLTDHVYS
jgi:hypothetical protein